VQYPIEISERADQELRIRRLSAQNELGRRVDLLRAQHPDIDGLRREISVLGVLLGRESLANDAKGYGRSLTQIKDAHVAITAALAAAGLPEDYLEAPYTCKKCEDKGLYMGQYCECRRQILNRLTYERLCKDGGADCYSFEIFDLNYYPDGNRKAMGKLLEACRRYAAEFSRKSPNLLFLGPTGLGKTHLSLAIAREVLARDKLVMYASAVRLIERLVDSAMGDESEDEYRELVYGCDLLIIDDLGTEVKTRITISEVYNLINTRIIERRPTIVNTNLSLKEIESTYDQRILSRLAGDYALNQFTGSDIRFQKKARRYNGKTQKREGSGTEELAGG
jgi:DNA replication protein DnaC